MNTGPLMKRLMCLAGLLLSAFACDSSAATITKSATAPAVNDEDLANFGTQTGTDKWWPENSATGAAKGQTFRTRNEALRFKAATYRITTSVPGTKVYTIRLGKISGTTFTPVYTESATQTVAWAANDYVTWRLATPFVLQPNTFYGVDVALKSSSTDWQEGIPYISMTADEFSDGVSYISGTSGVGNGTITGSTEDRRFHLDIEKPIGGWTLVATDPADNSANAYASNPLFATFSQNIVRGTGNLTLKNLTDGVNTVIPITDERVLISENLLTVNPGTNYLANKAYAVRIDSTAITNVLGANYPGIANDTTWNFSTGAGDPLYLALVALKKHITGATPLTATQIAAHKTTLDQEYTRLADSAALITASFDLVKAYDASSGNRWYVNGLPARDSVTDDIHWTLWKVQQYIMDVTYNDTTLARYESVLNGFKFGSASSFPGACSPPANSNTTHTVTIKASYANTLGWTTQGDGGGTFARKPTGCYLAPGSIATVTVPAALVGKGFKIRVGAHSWDFSNKPSIKRLDRSTILYPINAVETKIACPHGGGIYIEVPWLANQGIVNVSVRNAVRSPYFSAKSFHQTTPTEWLTERTNAAPWADFQSDKFMMQVPRSWIYAMPDPTQLMMDWDAAMDAFNDLLGFPQIRGKESFYLQVDVLTRASVYAPGYPAVNVGGYSATANYNNGYNTHFFIRGPQYGTDDAHVEFHEQGHGYSFDKFPGETESNVNLPFVPVLHRNFGTTLDAAFRASLGEGNTYRTLETTAMTWMTMFNFSPREVEMADGEKAYQLKGHAKFVDIARIYGWGVLGNYWKSFVTDYENGVNYGTDTDSLLLRLSKNVGADIRPLFHFWGIYPQSPATLKTAIANANLVAPVEIYDRLVRYKSLVPPNNSSFTNFAYKWWSGKPSIDGYWEEREHARQWDSTADYPAGDQQRSQATNPGEIYNENSAFDITNRVQELLNLYYPNGRPTTITSPIILSLSPADNSTNVALEADFVVTFNKAIVRGTGNITLTNLTDGTSANIAVTDTSQISIVGEVLTINRTANLLANKTYAIRIAPTAIGGLATNSFAGITNSTTWNFTTINPDVTAPTIVSLTPSDGAANVALGANLVATFSEPILRGTGNITLKNLTDVTQTTIAVTNTAQVSVSGAVLTVNPTADLIPGKTYAIQIAATAIDDLATNSFAGISNDTTWNFTVIIPDVTAPTIVSLSPADGAANVALGANLVATFSEPIVRGTGNITLKNLTDVTQTTIAITNTAQVSVSGAVLTVNPTADLIAGKTYAIQIAATAIDDLATNSFAGIANDTTWNFTTINPDVTAPTIVSLTPSDGATNVTLGANLVATFSEPILRGSGNITLKNLTDATQTTIAVTNTAQVSVSSAVLTINPTALLSAGKTYAVQIAATAIDDLATNSFAGIATDTTWNFTTLAVENVPPVAGYSRWFDASGLALTNGAFVTSWSDGSASAAEATVPSGNAKPRFVTDSGMESGRPVIYFTKGTDATYSATNSAALRFTSANSVRTIFSIFKGDSFLLTHASTWHFHRPTDTDPTAPLWHSSWTSASIRDGQTYVNGDLVNGLAFNLSTNLHNGFNLVCVVTTNAVQADSFNKDRNFHSGNQYQAEVILYDRVLDDTERKAVEAYLINKWFSSPASDYSVWAANWPSTNLSDPNADFDNDGQFNDNERLWGLNPKNNASRTPFASITDLAAGTFIYTRRTPSLTGYSYTVWTSTNLVDWTQDVSAVQTPGVPVSDIETVTVTLSPSLLTSPTLFLRLRATLD